MEWKVKWKLLFRLQGLGLRAWGLGVLAPITKNQMERKGEMKWAVALHRGL